MKIPIFEEFIFVETPIEKLPQILSQAKIGKVPLFFNLQNKSPEESLEIISILQEHFFNFNLHPYFPYPFYLVTQLEIKSIFPKSNSIKELPEHFFKKIKRPNNKELQLLNKVVIKTNKIQNLDTYNILREFQSGKNEQRELYNLSKELYFLEILCKKILPNFKD